MDELFFKLHSVLAIVAIHLLVNDLFGYCCRYTNDLHMFDDFKFGSDEPEVSIGIVCHVQFQDTSIVILLCSPWRKGTFQAQGWSQMF